MTIKQNNKAEKAFEQFLKDFGIEKTDFRGRVIYKFETNNLPRLLANLSECHERLYRIILTTHLTSIPNDERIKAIQDVREFTANYLDRATNELIDAFKRGESISKSFGVVK